MTHASDTRASRNLEVTSGPESTLPAHDDVAVTGDRATVDAAATEVGATDVGSSASHLTSDRTDKVVAILVTRGDTDFLAATMRAISAQTLRPARLMIVDVGPLRRSNVHHTHGDHAALAPLTAQGGDRPTRVSDHHAPSAATFGEAVAAGLAALGEPAGTTDSAPDASASANALPKWLWLLHDDSAPEPEALAELVRGVEHKVTVAIAGAKQRDWFAPERLIEVGLTSTPAGRRMTGIEPSEVDQGQHDAREDVLGTGLAGALFRTDVWTELEGTDPAYGAFGDGLEVSRRARLAGYRVIVVPTATVLHAQASLNGLRGGHGHAIEPVSAGGATSTQNADISSADNAGATSPDADGRSAEVARETAPSPRPPSDRERSYGGRLRSALYARVVTSSPAAVPLHTIAILVLAPLRAMWQLAVKRPARARFEITTVVWLLLHPFAVSRSRARARRTATVPRRTLKPLRASWRDVVSERRDLRLARAELRRTNDAPNPLDRADRRRALAKRAAALAGVGAVLTALSVWWFGPITGALSQGARLVSPSLAPTADTGASLFAAITSGWNRSGFGDAVATDPLMTVLAPLSFLSASGAQSVIHAIIVSALVVGGLGAWFAAGTATHSLLLRAWAAIAWIALPVAGIALTQGRLGALIAHIALPWAALGTVRALGLSRPFRPEIAAAAAAEAEVVARLGESLTPKHDDAALSASVPAPAPRIGSIPAAAGAGLALGAAVGGSPVLFGPALVILGLLALGVRTPTGQRGYRRNLVLVGLPAVAVMIPLLAGVVARGARETWPALVGAAGIPVDAEPAVGWQQLLGWPSAPSAWGSAEGAWGYVYAGLPYALTGLIILVAAAALLRANGSPAAATDTDTDADIAAASDAEGPGDAGRARTPRLRTPRRHTGSGRMAAVRLSWLVAAIGLAGALGSGLVLVGVGQFTAVRGFSGPLLSLAFVGFLGAFILGLDGAGTHVAKRSFGWRQGGLVVLTLALVVVTGGTLARTIHVNPIADGRGEGLTLRAAAIVPAVGQQLQAPPRQARILAIAVGPETTYQLLHADGPQLVDTSVLLAADALHAATSVPDDAAPTDAAPTGAVAQDAAPADIAANGGLGPESMSTPESELAAAVAGLVGGVDVPADDLARLGIGAVLITADGVPADRTYMGNRFDTIPALERIAESDSGVIWRVAVAAPETALTPDAPKGAGPKGAAPKGAAPKDAAPKDGVPAGAAKADGAPTSDDVVLPEAPAAILSPAAQPAWARILPAAELPSDPPAPSGQPEPSLDAAPGIMVASDGLGIDTKIEASSDPRRLVLAERADSGWRATLDGEPLRALSEDWRQSFEVPASGGRLVVWHESASGRAWGVVLIVLAGLYALLAIPVRRRVGVR